MREQRGISCSKVTHANTHVRSSSSLYLPQALWLVIPAERLKAMESRLSFHLRPGQGSTPQHSRGSRKATCPGAAQAPPALEMQAARVSAQPAYTSPTFTGGGRNQSRKRGA